MKIRAFNIPEVSTYTEFLRLVLTAYKKQRTEDDSFNYLCIFIVERLVISQPQYMERLLADIKKVTTATLSEWCKHNTDLDYFSSFKAVRVEFLKQLIAANTQESSKS